MSSTAFSGFHAGTAAKAAPVLASHPAAAAATSKRILINSSLSCTQRFHERPHARSRLEARQQSAQLFSACLAEPRHREIVELSGELRPRHRREPHFLF